MKTTIGVVLVGLFALSACSGTNEAEDLKRQHEKAQQIFEDAP